MDEGADANARLGVDPAVWKSCGDACHGRTRICARGTWVRRSGRLRSCGRRMIARLIRTRRGLRSRASGEHSCNHRRRGTDSHVGHRVSDRKPSGFSFRARFRPESVG
jgi:hypothetical protein